MVLSNKPFFVTSLLLCGKIYCLQPLKYVIIDTAVRQIFLIKLFIKITYIKLFNYRYFYGGVKMGFMDKARAFSENAAEKAKKISGTAAEKAGDLAETAKIKYEISGYNTDIKRKYEQIGVTVYDGLINGGDCQEEIAEYCRQITELKEKIADLEKLL